MHKYKLHIRRNIAGERASAGARARLRALARDLIFNLIKNNEAPIVFVKPRALNDILSVSI